jgi:site-specific DNA recombinase
VSDKAEVEAVLKIFDGYDAGGMSLRRLRDHLNAKGRNPRTGSLWSEISLKHILSNPAYTGDFIWPHRSLGKYTRVVDKLPEPVVIRNNHPALISREQFDHVQRKMKTNRRFTTPLNGGGKYLLSGLLYCQNCGRKMYGWTNQGYEYYKCSGHTRFGKSLCGLNSVRQDEILGEVVSVLESWADNPATLAQIDADLAALVQQATSRDSVDVLEARLATIDQKLTRAEERLLIVDDDMVPTVQKLARELRAERELVAADLKSAKVPVRSLKARQEARIKGAMSSIRRLRSELESGEPARVRAFLAGLIERVDVRIVKRLAGTGKRFKYTLQSGEIRFVNPLQLVSRSSQRGGLT